MSAHREAREWLEGYPEPLRIRDGIHKQQIVLALSRHAAHVLRGLAKRDTLVEGMYPLSREAISMRLRAEAERLEAGNAD